MIDLRKNNDNSEIYRKQYTEAFSTLQEAVTHILALQYNPVHNKQLYSIEKRVNSEWDHPLMKFNPDLKDLRNWRSSCSYPAPVSEKELDRMSDVERDLTLNYTSTWCKSSTKEQAKSLIDQYHLTGNLEGIMFQSGGFYDCDFAIKKSDFLKIRPDLGENWNFWTTRWAPRDGVPYRIPTDGYSYSIVVSDKGMSLDDIKILIDAELIK